MTKDVEREAFERFIFGNDYESLKANYDEYEKEHGFRYPPFTYDREWESWQAAKAHEAKKLEGCVVVPQTLSLDLAKKRAEYIYQSAKKYLDREYRDLSATEMQLFKERWIETKAVSLQTDYLLTL